MSFGWTVEGEAVVCHMANHGYRDCGNEVALQNKDMAKWLENRSDIAVRNMVRVLREQMEEDEADAEEQLPEAYIGRILEAYIAVTGITVI